MDVAATWIRRAPTPGLRGVVEGYLGYRLHSGIPGVHLGLPSRHMTFIVSIGASIDVIRQTNAKQAPGQFRTIVGGLQSRPALIAHAGTQEGVAISVSPLGCLALFGLPAAELWDLSAELSSVVGRAGDEIWERVQTATSWEARFQVCDRVLLAQLGESRTIPGVAAGWAHILASGGLLPIAELASRAGYSRQHLTRLFRRELGLGPKEASRVVRFERAVGLLRAVPQLPLSDVAQLSGFADQAHLSREFATMAGTTPGELRARGPSVVPPELFHTSKTQGLR